MKHMKACIMCGSMLESETERHHAICSRCRAAKEPGPVVGKGRKPETPEKRSPSLPPIEPEDKKILILDDEPMLLKLLANRLKAKGFTIITASNGDEGYRLIKAEKPDLVLSDILMPGLTGYDLLQRLKKETDGTRNTPVLIMTAKGGMKDFFDSWEIHGFMMKPLDPEELYEKICGLLREAAVWKKEKRK